MSPAIEPEDRCIVNPFAYSSAPIERFDMVVYKAPDEVAKKYGVSGNTRYLKRVIGLPGETLEIKNNQIFINGVLLNEPFERIVDEKDFKANLSQIEIPADEYFVMGDNRPNSEDSRHYRHPTINKKDIFSKVINIQKGVYKQN